MSRKCEKEFKRQETTRRRGEASAMAMKQERPKQDPKEGRRDG